MISTVDQDYWNDARWASEHLRDLNNYRDLWVAIVDRKPVAYGKDHDEVKAQAKRLTGRAHIYMIFIECSARFISVQ